MDIRPTHAEADYKAALREITALMETDPASCTSSWAFQPRC